MVTYCCLWEQPWLFFKHVLGIVPCSIVNLCHKGKQAHIHKHENQWHVIYTHKATLDKPVYDDLVLRYTIHPLIMIIHQYHKDYRVKLMQRLNPLPKAWGDNPRPCPWSGRHQQLIILHTSLSRRVVAVVQFVFLYMYNLYTMASYAAWRSRWRSVAVSIC